MLGALPHTKSDSPTKLTASAGSNVPIENPVNFWLDAHYDRVATLKTFSTCMHTCDLFGDGDWRLAVAGLDKKLKATFCVLRFGVSTRIPNTQS